MSLPPDWRFPHDPFEAPMRRTLPLFLAASLSLSVGCDAFHQAKDAAIDRQLAKVAVEVNKDLPKMVDPETRFDSTSALPGKVLKYSYTLINLRADQIDPKRIQDGFRPELVNKVKTVPEMAPLRAQGVTFVYHYVDKDGALVANLEIGPKEYGN